MGKGILLSKAIYSALKNDTILRSYVGENIYPLLIPESTKVNFPYVIFSRQSVIPKYTKDGSYDDDVTVEINVCDNDYTRSCDIAQRIRDILDFKSGDESGLIVKSIRLNNVSEQTYDIVYIQKLTFSFIVGNQMVTTLPPTITPTVTPTVTAE